MAFSPNYTISSKMVEKYLKHHGIPFDEAAIQSWSLHVGLEIEVFLAYVNPRNGHLQMLSHEKTRDAIIMETRRELGEIFSKEEKLVCWLDKDRCFKFVDSEYWVSMIELGTPPSLTIAEQERYYRTVMAVMIKAARKHGVFPLAVSTPPNKQHPNSWRPSSNPRYKNLQKLIGHILRMFKIAGTQSQVEIQNADARVRHCRPAMNLAQFAAGLTANSPIFEGELQPKVASRYSMWRNFDRTDVPQDEVDMSSLWGYWGYLRKVVVAVEAKAKGFLTKNKDGTDADEQTQLKNAASVVWFPCRPNQNHSTGEFRTAETTPYILDSLLITAIYRSLVRYIIRHPEYEMVQRAILRHNIKAAEGQGIHATLIDNDGNEISFRDALYQFLDMLQEDAEALGDWEFIRHQTEVILSRGTAAEKLVEIWKQHTDDPHAPAEETIEAQQACMQWLIDATDKEAFMECQLKAA